MANNKSKIKIKPFYPRMTMDPEYANNTWKLLQNAILEIYNKNASGLSFEELYRNSYNMVLHKHGDKLYDGLKQTVHDRLVEVCQKVVGVNDENLLQVLNEQWDDHTQSMLMIRDILMYMDRVYVVHNNLAPVYDVGLQKFRDNITRHANIKDRLLNSLLGNIEKERRGEAIARGLMKNITTMLVDLGIGSKVVYEEDFEKHFLAESEKFYRIEAQEFISTNSCPEYMKKVENRINEEVERVNLIWTKVLREKFWTRFTMYSLQNICRL
jgi:cullin 3